MHAAVALILLVCFVGGFKTARDIPESELNLTVGSGEMVRFRQNINPLSVSLDKNIVKQSHDFSCGSAALGTLLNFSLGESFAEKQIIEGLMKYGDKEQIKKLRAFSMWDMQQFVQALGYSSGGYNAELSDLKDPTLWPCIVPVELFGYRHFVVLKGIYKDHVFVADPWRGNGSYTLNQFTKMWYKNVLFKVEPKGNRLSSHLRLKEEDLRFIDQDMERSLMFGLEQPFNIPRELETDFYVGPNQRYKQ